MSSGEMPLSSHMPVPAFSQVEAPILEARLFKLHTTALDQASSALGIIALISVPCLILENVARLIDSEWPRLIDIVYS